MPLRGPDLEFSELVVLCSWRWPSGASALRRKMMKILIVEDEKLLADSIRDLLTEQGSQTEAVYDGEAGVAYAATGV